MELDPESSAIKNSVIGTLENVDQSEFDSVQECGSSLPSDITSNRPELSISMVPSHSNKDTDKSKTKSDNADKSCLTNVKFIKVSKSRIEELSSDETPFDVSEKSLIEESTDNSSTPENLKKGSNGKSSGVGIDKSSSSGASDKMYPCYVCDFSTNYLSSLKEHIVCRHSNKRPFSCTFCQYKARRKPDLRKHIIVVHQGIRKYGCGFCDYSTSHSASLKRHINAIHTLKEVHPCTHCNYKTFKRENLIIHLANKHSEGDKNDASLKLFHCDNCCYSTANKNNLKDHIVSKHIDEKPFPCPINDCNFRSNQKSALTRHIAEKHIGEKRHKCTDCPYSSFRLSRLKEHFANKHSGSKTFSCVFCSYATNRERALDSHVAKKHQNSSIGLSNGDNFQSAIDVNSSQPIDNATNSSFNNANVSKTYRHKLNKKNSSNHINDICQTINVQNSSASIAPKCFPPPSAPSISQSLDNSSGSISRTNDSSPLDLNSFSTNQHSFIQHDDRHISQLSNSLDHSLPNRSQLLTQSVFPQRFQNQIINKNVSPPITQNSLSRAQNASAFLSSLLFEQSNTSEPFVLNSTSSLCGQNSLPVFTQNYLSPQKTSSSLNNQHSNSSAVIKNSPTPIWSQNIPLQSSNQNPSKVYLSGSNLNHWEMFKEQDQPQTSWASSSQTGQWGY